MPMHSEEYKRGYDAGYRQALLDAIKQYGEDHKKRIDKLYYRTNMFVPLK